LPKSSFHHSISQQIPQQLSAEALPPWCNQSLSPESEPQSTDPVGQSDFHHLRSPLVCRQTYDKLYANNMKLHTNLETNILDKPVGDLVRAPPLSNFRALSFRNKGLNQNFVEILYAGNVGHHYTKISENWIKNCRKSSISRNPSENEVFCSQFRR